MESLSTLILWIRRNIHGAYRAGRPWVFLSIGPTEIGLEPNPDRLQSFRERLERETPDPRRAAGEIRANTARKLVSVWDTEYRSFAKAAVFIGYRLPED